MRIEYFGEYMEGLYLADGILHIMKPSRTANRIVNVEVTEKNGITHLKYTVMQAMKSLYYHEFTIREADTQIIDMRAETPGMLLSLFKRDNFDNCPTLSKEQKDWLDTIDPGYTTGDYSGEYFYCSKSGKSKAIKVGGIWIPISDNTHKIAQEIELPKEVLEEIFIFDNIFDNKRVL